MQKLKKKKSIHCLIILYPTRGQCDSVVKFIFAVDEVGQVHPHALRPAACHPCSPSVDETPSLLCRMAALVHITTSNSQLTVNCCEKGQGKNAFAAGIVLQHSCVSNRIKQLYVFAWVVRQVAACMEQRSGITLVEQGCFCISLEILLVQIYWCHPIDIMSHSKREMAITCNSRRSKGRWRRNKLYWVTPGN